MVMFGVLGNTLGDADSRALARRLGLSNDELAAMLFGANHANRLARLDALGAEELIDLAGQFGEQGVLSLSQGGAVAVGAVAGADPRAVVGALTDALGSRESVGGREVMDANGLSPADIGGDDGPSGEEFGQLVREARADHFRANRE